MNMNDFQANNMKERLEEEGIDVADIESAEYKSPNVGGCWICKRKSPDMQFDMEFDTFYHQECLDKLGVDSILEFERDY